MSDVKSIFGRALELPDPAARATYVADACGNNAALRAEVEALLVAVDRAGGFLKPGFAADDGTGTFAADLQRYPAGEAGQAHTPSTGYRVKKFVRRHKGEVLAASLVLVTLVAGIVGTTLGLVEAQRQERVAVAAAESERDARVREAARAEGERAAREKAQTERERAVVATAEERKAKRDADARRQEAERNLAFARKGNEILGSVFTGLDPKMNYATPGELSQALADNLKRAVTELDGPAVGDPLEVAAMQTTLGLSLLSLGEYGPAVEVLQKARDTRTARLGPDHPDTLHSTTGLASSYRAAGMLVKALTLSEQTLPLLKVKLGPDHPDTLTTMNNLAVCYLAAGKLDKALPLFEGALALMKAKFGPDHPDTLTSMNDLASGYRGAGQLDKALPLFEETLTLRKAKLGPDHRDTLTSTNNLALGYQAAGKRDKALPLFEEALQLVKARRGPEHLATLITMRNLADCYEATGKLDKALSLREEMLTRTKARLGTDHPETLGFMNYLATKYWSLQRLDRSIPLFEELLPLQEKKLGREHPDTLQTVANLGVNYAAAGRLKDALPLLEEAHRAAKKHPGLYWIDQPLLDAYLKAGKTAEAGQLTGEQVAGARERLPKGSPQLADVLAQFSLPLLEAKAFAEAEPLLRECLTIREKTQPDAWWTFNAQSMLGGALLGQKKYADAEPLLLKGYEGMKARENTIPPQGRIRIPECLDRLIDLHTATNKPDEVTKWQAERAKYPFVAPPPREKK